MYAIIGISVRIRPPSSWQSGRPQALPMMSRHAVSSAWIAYLPVLP